MQALSGERVGRRSCSRVTVAARPLRFPAARPYVLPVAGLGLVRGHLFEAAGCKRVNIALLCPFAPRREPVATAYQEVQESAQQRATV